MHRSVFTIVALACTALLDPASAIAADDACEPQRLEPPTATPPEKYASLTATNGRFWFVADRSARTRCAGSPFSCATGAVHAYELVDGRLEFLQTIVPPDIRLYANFGHGMAVDGDRLLVGAPFHTEPGGLPQRGLVFEYGFDGERWVETGRIQPPPAVERDFGKTIVLRDDTMIVWSQRIVPERVFAYRLVGGEWVLTQSIWPAHDAVAWDFGRRMHLDEDWLFVSAYRDSSTFRFGGSVFVYRREADGRFSFFQKLTVDFHGQFGVDLAYNGRSLLVGVPGYQPDHPVQGGIYAYSFDGDAWVLDQRLTLRDAATNDALGWNIVVEGDTMLASAQGKRTPESTGAVARFEQMPDGSWVDVDRLIPAPLERPQNYGNTVAMLDGRALVGSIDELVSTGEYHGAAYFFDLACGLCAPDLDLDGQLTIFDYLTFLNLFDAGSSEADFDGDGELTVLDFLAYQTAFDAGCA